MEVTDPILYNTISPLSLSATTHSTPPPPVSSDDSEPYLVLRNQISVSSIHRPLPDTDAVDYFSLDVEDDEDEFEDKPIDACFKTPTAVKEPERTLEGNWFHSNSRLKSPMLQLHKEIIDFCDFLSPTPEEQESRDAAIKRVFDVIKYIWPNCKPEVFGSFHTGLYLPSSDIDVVILESDIKSPQIGLNALSRALSQRGIAKKIQVISRARVPIVKFVEKRSGIAFDLSFDLQNGPKAAEFIKDAVSKWPHVRPLCLILKVFLQQRELNEVYTGGIGSYALLAMLIAMLRMTNCTLQSQPEWHTSPEHNLGVLLVNFFDIYGRKLNTSDVGVSCNGEGTFYKKSSKGFTINGKSSLISIQDPQTPENDIGKSSFNYFQVRSAFAMAFTTLTNTRTILSLGPKRSILGTIIRPDAVLLERKGGVNGEVTFNNLLPGAGDPVNQHYEDQQEMYCNWRLNDEEEEPLPRENLVEVESSEHSKSSGKRKRTRTSAQKIHSKKGKENGDVEVDNGNSNKKEKRAKKPRWRHLRNGGDSRENGHFRGGSSTWGHS